MILMLPRLLHKLFLDNKSLVQSVYSTTLVSEKRLRVDLAAIQQTVERREATLKWISSKEQIADCLTKACALLTSFWTLSSMESYICIQVNRNNTFYRQWTIFIKTIIHYLHSIQGETMGNLLIMFYLYIHLFITIQMMTL